MRYLVDGISYLFLTIVFVFGSHSSRGVVLGDVMDLILGDVMDLVLVCDTISSLFIFPLVLRSTEIFVINKL